jgi:hypothetical protein
MIGHAITDDLYGVSTKVIRLQPSSLLKNNEAYDALMVALGFIFVRKGGDGVMVWRWTCTVGSRGTLDVNREGASIAPSIGGSSIMHVSLRLLQQAVHVDPRPPPNLPLLPHNGDKDVKGK